MGVKRPTRRSDCNGLSGRFGVQGLDDNATEVRFARATSNTANLAVNVAC